MTDAADSTTPVPTTTTTTTTETTPVSHTAGLGKNPASMKCPYCKKQMVTNTEDKSGMVAMIGCFALLLFFLPLFWLPLCLPACKDTDHTCSLCNRRVGTVAACS